MPFVIRYPREIGAGLVNDDIITNVDFAELFLDYAGVEAPASMQGRSFRANLRGAPPADWPTAMYYHYWSPNQPVRPSHYGIRTRDHKLIYYYGLVRDEGRRPEDCWELYDLARDPHEFANRYAEPGNEARIAELRDQLEALRGQCGDTSDPVTTYGVAAG